MGSPLAWSQKDLDSGLAPEQACLGTYLSQVCNLGSLKAPCSEDLHIWAAVTIFNFFKFSTWAPQILEPVLYSLL